MKSIKMLGFATFAVLMAIALLGTSSAMAETTQLCKVDQGPCEAGNVVSHIHEQTLTGSPSTLLSSLGSVLCAALFLGDSLGAGAPLVIHGHFTYSNCVRDKTGGGTENCTASEVSTDSLINLLKLSTETADVTVAGKVNVHCGIFINCTYNGTGLAGTTKGPLIASSENGEVTFSEQTLSKESGLCPETGKLDLTTTPLEAIYISGLNPDPMECVARTRGLYEEGSLYECTKDDPEHKGAYELIGN
jgi:hypothetical protein